MGKISNTTQYPPVTPVADDYVIGTQDGVGTPTKNFLMSAISAFINGSHGLQEVCDVNQITTTGMTIGGALVASSTANISDTLTLSKATGTGLIVTAGSILNGSLDANSTADISDTLTLSKATGTGLSVTSSVSVGGQLSAGTSVVGQASVLSDGFQTNNSSFTATSSAVSISFGTTFTAFGATIADTLSLTKATGNGLMVTSDIFVGGSIGSLGTLASVGLNLQPSTPASSTATGVAGDVKVDADYIYVCTATDTWRRVAIATW